MTIRTINQTLSYQWVEGAFCVSRGHPTSIKDQATDYPPKLSGINLDKLNL